MTQTTTQTTKTIHIIGGGLSGLSAAVSLCAQGWIEAGGRIIMHEAGIRAGGRCRSYHDALLACEIDNGNHLMMGAYKNCLAYAKQIGGDQALYHPAETYFDFADLKTETAWRLRLNEGPIPWWVFSAKRRIPDTRPADYLGGLKLLRARPGQNVSDCLDPQDPLFARLWQPFVEGVMNAKAEDACASLLSHVVRETFGKGGKACRPIIAKTTLAQALVDPALRFLEAAGVEIRFGARLKKLTQGEQIVQQLHFATEEPLCLGPEDQVILAVPPQAAAQLLPGLVVPEGQRTITNVHFRLPERLAMGPWFMGLIHSQTQWLFLHDDRLSVTISVADHLNSWEPEAIATLVWQEIYQALMVMARSPEQFPGYDYGLVLQALSPKTSDKTEASLPALPPFRVVKEKRATFLQSAAEVIKRPPTQSAIENLYLAGDWTDTGLPATIEGAIQSGAQAARCLLAKRAL